MTADIELLPLYAELQGHPKIEIIKHYAHDNVAHHTEKLHAENEALRAEVKSLQTLRDVVIENHGYWKDHAERMAEALRELVALGHPRDPAIIAAKNALPDHDKEGEQ